jgi:outer membrane protein TolC
MAEHVVRIGLENLRSTRLAVVADVKKAYYGYYLNSVSIDVTRENQDFLRRVRDVANAKLRAGTAPQQDVLRAEVELYELSNDLLTLEQERRTSTALLNVLMDRAVEAELPLPLPFDPQGVDWKLAGLMARAVEVSPELKAIQEEVHRDLEALRLAKMEYLPDFMVGGAYGFIGGGISPVANGKDVWNLMLGMSLPVWVHRIRAGILERNAESLASALEYRSRRNDVFFAIQESLVRVDTQYRSAVLFRDTILPRARQTVEVSESGYQAGQVDFLTWIDNWRRLLDFTLEYHRALTALERAFADLEALVGGALPKSAATDALPAQPEASKSE